MNMLHQAQEIMAMLAKKDWWERQQAIVQLLACPEQDVIGELEKGIRNHGDADIRNVAMEVYKVLGIRGFASLASLLQDSDCEARLFAVNILCDVADRRAYPVLVSALEDRDVNVRVAAAEALGKIRDDRAVPILERALHDEPWVAMAAVNALGDIGGEAALSALYGCLETEGCREIAITVLGKAGNADTMEYLAVYLGDDRLSELALKATIRIAEREQVRLQPEYFMHHIAKLMNMMRSPDTETRKAAISAIIWSRDFAAQQWLIDATRDPDLREHALEGILQIGRRAVPGIIDEIRNTYGPHRRMLVKVLDMLGEQTSLLQFSDDADPEVRTEVALALGAVKIARATGVLQNMMNDPVEEVRIAAKISRERQGMTGA